MIWVFLTLGELALVFAATEATGSILWGFITAGAYTLLITLALVMWDRCSR